MRVCSEKFRNEIGVGLIEYVYCIVDATRQVLWKTAAGGDRFVLAVNISISRCR